MRVGVISDIHGNWEALKEVEKLGKKLKVDSWWCLGDIVGYYPQARECVEWVADNCEIVVKGNHDYATIDISITKNFTPIAREAILFTRKVLEEKHLEFLQSLPLVYETDEISLSHSNPFNPESWFYVFDAFDVFCLLSGREKENLKRIYLIGHTHIPTVFLWDYEKVIEDYFPVKISDGKVYVINPGSVGQPRDGVNRASFLIFDKDGMEFVNYRVEYDYRRIMSLVIEKRLPPFLAERLEKGI